LSSGYALEDDKDMLFYAVHLPHFSLCNGGETVALRTKKMYQHN
jgi:hypothetical protein